MNCCLGISIPLRQPSYRKPPEMSNVVPLKKPKPKKIPDLLQLRIELAWIKPKIWRRIVVPEFPASRSPAGALSPPPPRPRTRSRPCRSRKTPYQKTKNAGLMVGKCSQRVHRAGCQRARSLRGGEGRTGGLVSGRKIKLEEEES